jgi:rubrerythrin
MMESRKVEQVEVDVKFEAEMSFNRTGIMTNPELSAELIRGAKETIPSSKGDATHIAAHRAKYLNDVLPIGSPPVVMENGEENPEGSLPDHLGGPVLLDKLGERLAFERQGTRLYEAFLKKIEALALVDGSGPSVEDLQHICEEELEHFTLLQKVITGMGADATVQTPSADIVGVLSHGILQIVTDPRTTIAQTLQAMLNAELADNDGWEMLQGLAAELGQKDLEEQCQRAFEEEQEHLKKVRGWLLSMTLDEATAMEADEADVKDEGGEANDRTDQPRKGRNKLRKKSAKSSGSSKGKKKRKK